MITKDNAREMALKSQQTRKEQLQELRTALQVLSGDSGKEYRARRVARVRRQLDRIDEMMMLEQDPQKLDRLASAQARLSEQERVLSGTPLPGSLRPAAERAPRSSGPESSPAPADPTFTPPPVVSPEPPQEAAAGAQDIVGL